MPSIKPRQNEGSRQSVPTRPRRDLVFVGRSPHHIGPDDQAILKGAFDERSLSGSSVAQGGPGPAPRAARPPARAAPRQTRCGPRISFLLPEPGGYSRHYTPARWCLCGAARARWCPSGAAPAPQKPCHSVAGPLARRFGTPELCARSVEFARARSRSRSRSNTSTSLTI